MARDENIIGKRIEMLRKRKNLSREKLGAIIGIAGNSIYRIEAGYNLPSADVVIELSKFFDVPADYILGIDKSFGDQTGVNMKKIPVYEKVAAGVAGVAEPIDYPIDEIYIPLGSKGEFAVEVVGDSMEPEIKEGDYVIVDTNSFVESGDRVVAIINDGADALVKVYRKFMDGPAMLYSLNQKYDPIVLTEELKWEIVGKVVSLYRRYR
ncbi:helix-turn-helix domain-containing protein [Marinitoga litoralis]|uniref:helix-turn-helix domain-containing protein n=1 Tax=Marinitoga litoralis TaxID=570855 RepID=UPI00195FF568|nr:XRE family transcriptional regulator [Marinitoga litoralis]MBM7558383.1 repressor LexA [Marinitoga litoralis]